MSEYKTKIMLGAFLAVLIAVGLAGAAIFLAPQTGTGISTQTRSTGIQGPQSVLIVQLTDPPIVPVGTTSLNLTYSAINLLVAEPSTTTSTITSTITGTSTTSTTTITSTMTNKGQVTPQTVAITPTGGSATVNLLKLQNISQTIASANLTNGSTIYSVSFVVSGTHIDINGVISPVTLATGGNTLLVTLARPATLEGTNAILLDLNPTIINTTTGYQMIPSAVGVIKPQSEITSGDHQVGYTHQLTDQDQNDINQAKGQVTAGLVSLSVSGNKSAITVNVNNTGTSPVQLVAISLSGNFTDQSCMTMTPQQDNHGNSGQHQHECQGPNEIVFVPSVPSTSSSSTHASTTTTTSSAAGCTLGQMVLVNGDMGNGDNSHQLVIAPGQCVTLTFSGVISFGESGNAVVPSTLAGQTYGVHVIASNGAEMKLSCTLPLSMTSCSVTTDNNGQD